MKKINEVTLLTVLPKLLAFLLSLGRTKLILEFEIIELPMWPAFHFSLLFYLTLFYFMFAY